MEHLTGRILVVDDDHINRFLLCSLLETEGHTVVSAVNGLQALERLREQAFDIVLLDLIMPEMDGFETLAHIKADSALQHIPVIVISALDEKESIVRSITMGAADHLDKPPDVVLLRARVNASLMARRLLDEQVEHLRQINHLTAAAAAMEAGHFDPAALATVCARPDALGQLARVFNAMAHQVQAREQSLAEQNRVKSAFIRRMTHELRSPFVGAGFAAQLIQRYADRGMLDELRGQVERLDHALGEGRRLIDSMITYAALVSRSGPPQCEPLGVPDLIMEATSHLRNLAEVRHVQLSYDLPDTLPTLYGDRAALLEAISHLVHNAIKFNREGGHVQITARATAGWITLTVEDDGLGIPHDKLRRIWQAFEQAADDERRGVEGMGLGLALVHQVVTAHHGEVAATSRHGYGSTFGIHVPIGEAPCAEPAPAPATLEPSPTSGDASEAVLV